MVIIPNTALALVRKSKEKSGSSEWHQLTALLACPSHAKLERALWGDN